MKLRLLAALLLLGPVLGEEKPLNIVVLYADDWRFDTLGAAGNAYVRTPQLDRLASQGVSFSHAAVTTAICGSSRASFLTGQWMSRHHQRDFGAFRTPWADTLPGRLRAAGYAVAHVGKWHSGKFPAEQFDFGRAYHGQHWLTRPDGSKVHVTDQNRADALDFLRQRDPAKPFFLTVAFFAPHAEDQHPQQYLPPPGSFELYQDAPVPVPPNATPASTARLPEFLSASSSESRRRWAGRFDTPGKYQEMMKNYLRLVSGVDQACGDILAELDRQGLTGSTLIVFTGDNGYFHGEHGLADKWYPYAESIRVPLLVRDPRAPGAAGKISPEFVLNVDLAPTLLAAAGVAAPAGMQGRDFAPLYRGQTAAPWREDFFYEHPSLRPKHEIPASEALVTRGWKYIRWPEHDREQLFNLAADPREENDLIADPAAQAVLGKLRARFAELQTAAR